MSDPAKIVNHVTRLSLYQLTCRALICKYVSNLLSIIHLKVKTVLETFILITSRGLRYDQRGPFSTKLAKTMILRHQVNHHYRSLSRP